MSDPQLEAVPLAPSSIALAGAPIPPPVVAIVGPSAAVTRPLVEPLTTFKARLKQIAQIPGPQLDLSHLVTLPKRVSHRRWHAGLTVGQGGRGTCWAFAGVAALEAAYARVGTSVRLSEHYLFHITKAHENHRLGGGFNSLIGFGGSSDVVRNLKFWAVPQSAHVPYVDQGPLQQLANSLPGTGGGLANAAGGTREQADWFEFDLRHVPLMGRWFAQYRVKNFAKVTNYTTADIRTAVAAGYDVVVDVNDKLNGGGHVVLIIGYDDDAGTFEIKNSQGVPGFATMRYSGDAQFDLLQGAMHYITEVQPVETQWPAMWVGRWEMSHDGWRGRLVIRRFLDAYTDVGIPGPRNRISLGTWYGEDGRVLDVVGHFVDGGRGLHCTIGSQPFELYLHTRDPYRASGRCTWNNTPFGVVLSRGTAVGAGSGFDRGETIGLWDLVHDGWRGELRIGAQPSYVQAATSVARRAWIDPGATAHRVDAHVDFGGTNRDQRFQLLAHTHEDGLLGGITTWAGKEWPVEGRMSQNLYTIRNGALRWYRHTGRYRLVREWDPERVVGNGWGNFKQVFGGGDGVVYAVRPDGALLWYHHDGRNQGTFDWQGPKQVGTGWAGFRRIFAGDGGVIYAVTNDGRLLWYRHQGRRNGSARWQGPMQVGTGWGGFGALAAGPDGCIYGAQTDGTLLWYRHYGHDQGYPIWHGPLRVGSGWHRYDRIWAVGNGFIYGRRAEGRGDLWAWRHHGFLTGAAHWTDGVQVGNGWGGDMQEVFAT